MLLTVLATISVGLRFWARKAKAQSLGAYDYLIIAALVNEDTIAIPKSTKCY